MISSQRQMRGGAMNSGRGKSNRQSMNRKILRPLANKVKAAQNSANRFENKKPPRTWIPSGAS